MYCDGGTADTRTLLPDGQTPKKGTSEKSGEQKKANGSQAKGWKSRMNSTGWEFSQEESEGNEGGDPIESEGTESVEGTAGWESDDPDLLATIVDNPGTGLTDEVWNSDVGPILEAELKPNPEKKSKGAGKDRKGPAGYTKSPVERRAVVYFS